MRSRPDVRSSLSDSTSLAGEFSKREEAGSCCLVLRGFLCCRLVWRKRLFYLFCSVPMWCFQLVFSVTNQGSLFYLVAACCRPSLTPSRVTLTLTLTLTLTTRCPGNTYHPTPSCDEESSILCSHLLLVKMLRARP